MVYPHVITYEPLFYCDHPPNSSQKVVACPRVLTTYRNNFLYEDLRLTVVERALEGEKSQASAESHFPYEYI